MYLRPSNIGRWIGNAKQAKGDLDGAIDDYNRAIEINPIDIDAYSYRGIAKARKGDLEGAIADYTRAIELNPKDSKAYYSRGIAKSSNGDVDGAIADYNRAIDINPKFSEAYNNRGASKSHNGDQEGAVADFTRVIEINPKDIKSYHNRGLVKKIKGDLEGAIADYNRAIEINPKFSEAYAGIGECNYLQANWTDALANFRHACRLDKQESSADYSPLYLWIIRTRLGEGQAADKELAAYLDKRWNAAPNDWVSKLAGHLLGNVSEADLFAAADSPDTRKKSGQFCEAWYYAGMKKLVSGDKKSAAAYFRKCLATKRDDSTEFKFAQSELKGLGEP